MQINDKITHGLSVLLSVVFLPVLLAALLGLSLPSTVHAQSCTNESEPNETPAQATPANLSGNSTICLTGQLKAGDQDLFVWTVQEEQVEQTWRLRLKGVDAALTNVEIVRVTFVEGTQEVAESSKLFTFGTPDGEEVQSDDLLLLPGTYYVGVAVAGGEGDYQLEIASGEAIPASLEQEPNDDASSATPLAMPNPGTVLQGAGDLNGSDDFFTFPVGEAEATQRWRIQAHLPMGESAALVLENAAAQFYLAQDASSLASIELAELALPTGNYTLRFSGGKQRTTPYWFSIQAVGERQATHEEEPNGDASHAFPIDPSQSLDGSLLAHHYDIDVYKLTVDESLAARQWEISAYPSTPATYELCLLTDKSEMIQCRKGDGDVTLPALTDLILRPGGYLLTLRNEEKLATDYTIEFVELGEVDPTRESEPNDFVRGASMVSDEGAIIGRFVGTDDDYYRFRVTGEAQLWRIQVVGDGLNFAALSEIDGNELVRRSTNASNDYRNRDNAPIRLDDLYLLPGDHFVRVQGTDGDYTLRVLPLGKPAETVEMPAILSSVQLTSETAQRPRSSVVTEREPNNNEEQAERLPFDTPRSGRLLDMEDYDLYRISLAGNEQVRLNIVQPLDGLVDVRVYDLLQSAQQADGSAIIYQTVLTAGDYFIRIAAVQPSEEPYFILLERLNLFEPLAALDQQTENITESVPVSATALPLQVAFRSPNQTIASFWHEGQQLDLSLLLTSTSTVEQKLLLEATSSDMRWQLLPIVTEGDAPDVVALSANSSQRATVTIAAGKTRTLPISLRILPDVGGDLPPRISIRLSNDQGALLSTQVDLAMACDAPPVHPLSHWTTAGALRGGLNVAWLGLGSQPNNDLGNERIFNLFDDIVSPAFGWRGQADDQLTVDLAGQEAIPVAGILLNPFGQTLLRNQLRNFELRLSTDGQNFETVLTDEVTPMQFEQPFLLPKPILATHAQLRLIDNWGEPGEIGVGEFKVIATTAYRPPVVIDLLNPTLGGHVVSSSPLLGNMQDLLKGDDQSPILYPTNAGTVAEWLVGFHHNRAAQITAFHWRNASTSDVTAHFQQVELQVSLDSPLGPWQSLTTWQLDPTSTTTQTWQLDAPIWARFVRYIAQPPTHNGQGDGQTSSFFAYPDQLAIEERPIDESYRSILAEWGGSQPQAIYEEMANVQRSGDQINESEPNNGLATAQPLAVEQPINGQVQIRQDEDWYMLTVPDAVNTLTIHLTGSVGYALQDEAGRPITTTQQNVAGARVAKAAVVPGRYALRIFDPERSIVFTWDTSGSVGPYLATIYQSLARFTQSIDPQYETVNLLPFGDPGTPLLKTFSGEAVAVQTAFNNYPRLESSSSAESNLLTASELLSPRSGERTIMLMTDAESSSYGETEKMWRLLDAVRPRIFSFEISSAGNPYAQDLMQDWAAVRQGHYAAISTVSLFEQGFARASCLLRRPPTYQVHVAYSQESPTPTPEPTPPAEPASAPSETLASQTPGLLRVIGPTTASGQPEAVVGGGAVELILDASGSMLQLLDGRTRMETARDTLLNLVNHVLPADTPIALRVFGHKEAGSCRSDLEVPLQPLNPAAVEQIIMGIQAQNLAKTPIADSLRLVAEDLAGASGQKVVILVTDGEETCGGDPMTEIATLQAQTIDVRINIVGFAVDDPALQATFQAWATAGGGAYFNANNAAELDEAVTRALAAPFRVLNANGLEVARGFVNGEAVALPVGIYTVEILRETTAPIEQVAIQEGIETTLTVEE